MAEVTAEYLKSEIASLEKQRENAFAVFHQAVGAINLCRSLLQRLEEDEEQHPAIGLAELREGIERAASE